MSNLIPTNTLEEVMRECREAEEKLIPQNIKNDKHFWKVLSLSLGMSSKEIKGAVLSSQSDFFKLNVTNFLFEKPVDENLLTELLYLWKSDKEELSSSLAGLRFIVHSNDLKSTIEVQRHLEGVKRKSRNMLWD